MPPDGSSERPFVRNDLSGEAANVVQSGTINGDVHFHSPTGPALNARPIGDWDPFDLDVHRAITVADTSLPALPTYLRRAHDDELDAHLANVDRNTMIVLTGESSTGKTRALYEAVLRHEVLRDWPLVYPRTADHLVALSGRIEPGTVMWLNETQNHLGGAQAVSGLRALLEDAGPVVVLGTLWPQYWSTFVDEDAHARSLLQHRVVRVRVAERFDGDDVANVRADQNADPRLITALVTSGDGRQVIQTIAGGPALVERYEHPDDADQRYATAIVSAALDARRLGYQSLATRDLLADAAVGYLSTEDHVDTPRDWFEQGLVCAAKKGSHGITALIPKRVSPGVGPAEGYELHDYLDQHGQATRGFAKTPDSLWNAMLHHVEDAEDRLRLTTSAYNRVLYQYADLLSEDIETWAPYRSWIRMLTVLTRHGRVDAVLRLLVHVRSPLDLWRPLVGTIERLEGEGRTAESLVLLEALFKQDPRPPEVGRMLVEHFVRLGLLDDALAVYEQLPHQGQVAVGYALAGALAEQGRWDQALALARTGDLLWTQRWLADRFASANNIAGLRSLASANCLEATAHLVAHHLAEGRVDHALAGLAALRRAQHVLSKDLVCVLLDRGQVEAVVELAEERHPLSLPGLVEGLIALGQEDRATRILRVRIGDGHRMNTEQLSTAVQLLADHLVSQSRWAEALELVKAMPSLAYRWVPEQLAKVGNTDKLCESAEAGNSHALRTLINLLVKTRASTEALVVLRRFTAGGRPIALHLALVLADLRRFAELRERAVAGDRHCGEQLLRLAHRGELPDSDRFLRRGLNPDGSTA